MKKFFLYLPLAVLLVSCIQKEPLNAEADIETCAILNSIGQLDTNIQGNVIVANNRITAWAKPQINLSKLALDVKLTEGAVISPDPKQLSDYSEPRQFTVTSQDRRWVKQYEVTVDTSEIPTEYSFELSELNAKNTFDVFYEEAQKGTLTIRKYIWASGNPGFELTGAAKSREDYPTIAVSDGVEGKGVKLVTCSTGPFGEMPAIKMPIAAGNLFIGNFDVINALKDALKSTQFGLPFRKKPVSFTGYYKYKRGKVYTEVGPNGKPVPVKGEDACDIYAVLYRSEGLTNNTLHGDDVLKSSNIVALARVKNPHVYDPDTDLSKVDYEKFTVDFEYRKSFDKTLADNYKYNLAVVFTSSINGAYFKGAVGSTLYVDEVKVICE